ncbi:MAG: FaeA/PapI family transcriptional regulator [Candidatus Altiarchaeota archaeon]|nr:FaeA/PapI family transcriptional regulator [Candidatus Altiarchaeota archaeon]
MTKRKRRKKIDIKKEILDYLESIDFPNTTGGIADAVRLNWYMAKIYLMELKGDGKVFHKKVGRQDQWWTENVNESRRMVRVLKEKVNDQDKVLRELEKKGIVVRMDGKYRLKE